MPTPTVSGWFARNLSAISSHALGRRGEVHEPASAATGRRATQRGRGDEDKRQLPTGSNVEARRGVKLTALALGELVVILTGGAGETEAPGAMLVKVVVDAIVVTWQPVVYELGKTAGGNTEVVGHGGGWIQQRGQSGWASEMEERL